MALSDADKEAQLRAVGWSPSAGDSVQAAWSRTATPADQAAASGIGQTAPAVNPGGFDPAAFTKQITDAVTPLSQATSGVTAADLAEKKRQFDLQLEWTKQMWAQQGLPQLQIQQQAAALAQQEFESQKAIAAQNFGLAQQTQNQANALGVSAQTGYYTAPQAPVTAPPGAGASTGGWQAPTQDQAVTQRAAELVAQGFDQNRAAQTAMSEYQQGYLQSGNVAFGTKVSFAPPPVAPGTPGVPGVPGVPGAVQTLAGAAQQANLSGMYNGAPTEAARQFNTATGMDYLKTAASLGGPADYFQQANYLRGAQANGAPAFLQSLQNNTGLAAFNAPGGTAPGVQSMQSLAGGMTGSGQGNTQQAALNSIGAIGAAGGQALSPQALEQLNPDELNLFQSGLKASGFSMPSFLQSYQQSRIGQGAQKAA